MWIKLLLQLRELLPLLGRLLPLLEGWLAGNSGAAQANAAALRHLESRLAQAQDGLGGVEGHLREQAATLVAIQQEQAALRQMVAAESARVEQQIAEVATDVARLQLLAKFTIALLAMVVLLAAVSIWLAVRVHR